MDISARFGRFLGTERSDLPEYLSHFGYSSHALGKWHLGYCSPDYLPTRRGFESFYGFWNGGGTHKSHFTGGDMDNLYWSLGYDFHLNDDLAFGVIGSYTEDLFVDRVNNILSEKYGLVKNWVSGYPKGKVLIRNRNESSPFLPSSAKAPTYLDWAEFILIFTLSSRPARPE